MDETPELTSDAWRCPECQETVESQFDICWNCGTARDGTVDSEFKKVEELSSGDGLLLYPEELAAANRPSPKPVLPFQFSLRTLLLVVTACGIIFAVYRWIEQWQNQPHTASEFHVRGMERLDNKEYELAIHDFSQSLKLIQREDEERFLYINYLHRGIAYHKSKNYSNAVDDLSKVLERYPTASSAEGWIIISNKQKFVSIDDPSYVSHWYSLRADSYIGLAEYDKAIEGADQAINIDPKNAHAFFVRGFAWFKKGQSKKSQDDLTEAIRLNPSYQGKKYE